MGVIEGDTRSLGYSSYSILPYSLLSPVSNVGCGLPRIGF